MCCYLKMKTRVYFSEYYTPNVKIKGYKVVIYEKRFFDVPVKNKLESYARKS